MQGHGFSKGHLPMPPRPTVITILTYSHFKPDSVVPIIDHIIPNAERRLNEELRPGQTGLQDLGNGVFYDNSPGRPLRLEAAPATPQIYDSLVVQTALELPIQGHLIDKLHASLRLCDL